MVSMDVCLLQAEEQASPKQMYGPTATIKEPNRDKNVKERSW